MHPHEVFRRHQNRGCSSHVWGYSAFEEVTEKAEPGSLWMCIVREQEKWSYIESGEVQVVYQEKVLHENN